MPVEPRQYDPTRAHFGKELRSQRYIPEVGDFVTEVEFEVPHDIAFQYVQEDMDQTSYDVIGGEIVNERNSNKSRRKELRYPRQLDGNGGSSAATFPVVTEEVKGSTELMEFVDHAINTSQMVPKGTSLESAEIADAGLIKAELNQYGAYHNVLKITRAWDEAFQTRTSYDTDPTTGLRVRVTRRVVYEIPVVSTAPLPGVSFSYKHVADGVWIAEERQLLLADGTSPVINAGAAAFASYTYWTRINFTFPAYIRQFDPGVDLIRTLNKQQRRTIFDVRIRTRREFTANVWARKVVTFHATAPAKPAIFEWQLVDWIHRGALFSVNIERVIANETWIAAITLMNDTYFGAYTESVVFPASPGINTDQYLGQLGIDTLIDADVTQVENRVFRMVKTYVKMQ